MAKRYEMLWDCEYCGAKKLLGVTHRHCPSCGAPQNAEKRYFPPENEKIAVEDHPYFGADRECPYCKNPCSANSKFCGKCGGPLEGAGEVKRVGAPAPAEPAPAPEKPKSGGKLKWILGIGAAVGAAAIGLLIVTLFWTKSADLAVVGHSWERRIKIERYGPFQESEWCDTMPSSAYRVSRRREVRSHNRVPDGEECRTVKKDLGDGSYSEERECTTKYREEPVYDDKCDYTVDKWALNRTEKAEGKGLAEPPHWPKLSLKTGQCMGCEREGGRGETYFVHFQGPEKSHTCDFSSEKEWRTFRPESFWKAEIRVMTGGLVCGKLEPAG